MVATPVEPAGNDLVEQLADAARDAVLTQRRAILVDPRTLRSLTVEIALQAAGRTVSVRGADAYLQHHISTGAILGVRG